MFDQVCEYHIKISLEISVHDYILKQCFGNIRVY